MKSDLTRIRIALRLARDNVHRGRGGPFGAAVFDLDTGRLLGAGVNRVERDHDPTAHAEILAVRMAARRLKGFSFKEKGIRAGIYVSAEPCGMCLTALVWAGISRVVCAATTEDVEAIGFDEGLKPRDWKKALQVRGIPVVTGVERTAAIRILTSYKRAGGRIYNG
ncbi:MAG TPA: nucleoside deaminase [bacterium]|nr:nucleoside deaminase [bacterium]